MLSDGLAVLVSFAALALISTAIVLGILAASRSARKKKKQRYTGVTTGTVVNVERKGLDYPWVICASYRVDNISYKIKETAKLKTSSLKVGSVPIGQRKTFVLGPLKAGDPILVHYDEKNPQKAILYENDGVVTG